MTRRRLVVAGVTVAAAGAGLGWALRQRPTPAAVGEDAGAKQPNDLWSLRFAKPGGGELALSALRGRLLLLNFWATWCPPCVEEMPLLDRFDREHRAAGWRVVGLAADNATSVTEFLAAHPVGFAIGLAGMEGVALSRSLGNTHGSLPFSVGFNARGEAVARRLGALTWNELTAWAERVG